jgi:hypothetical protein
MFARFDHELPVGAELPFAAAQCVLVKRTHGKITVHGSRAGESELLEMDF